MSNLKKLNLKNGKFKFNDLGYLQNSKTCLENEANFSYKLVSESELKNAVKKVRRAKRKRDLEETWQQFLKLREEGNKNIQNEAQITEDDRGSCAGCFWIDLESRGSNQNEETPIIGNDDGTEDTNCQETVNSFSHTYQLGPGLMKRLQDLLSSVRKMTSVVVNPSVQQFEDEDVDRTIKRSQEFDAMFARNHLYEIQRLLKGTKKLLIGKVLNTIELEVKITAALKCVTQALQVYTRYASKGSRVKYQQLQPIFQSITAIEKMLERLTGQQSFPVRRDIDVSCSYLKQVLLEISSTDTKAVSVVSHKPARVQHKRKPSADLSMYNRRQKAEWRKKASTLAHARFGNPSKKSQRQTGFNQGKEYLNKLKIDEFDREISFQDELSKEPVTSKDVPHRNATRAVPEEKITTMMEMIPFDPVEDGTLNLGDSTFQALKMLNARTSSTLFTNEEKTNLQGNVAVNLFKNKDPSLSPSTPKPKSSSPMRQDNVKNVDSKPASAKSSAREPNNVQLVCLKEMERKSEPVFESQDITTEKAEAGKGITLIMDEAEKSELMEYKTKISDYQKTCPLYKEGKALGIVDRLANHILTDMIMDFQRNEMDEVIQILYNLEFQ